MSDCGNCDCSDKSQCVKKGSSYTLVIETEKISYMDAVAVDAPAAEHDGKCKCGSSCACVNCTCVAFITMEVIALIQQLEINLDGSLLEAKRSLQRSRTERIRAVANIRGNKRSIIYGIPKPPATLTKFMISPPTSLRDAYG
ncbi:hypothetical protein TIFTF001_014047 [Ficus carica]|uniref:Metallothionein-like protein n=1 Tax=Ficus carica TaxID=3494 RepID=A0AA88AFD0_FICCA|nr:hypothetical protein TIFTF001_014047 [Ficus carica]